MFRSTLRRMAVLAFVSSLALPSAGQGNVLIVDRYGPALFHEIHEAVAAAQDGDTILVRVTPGPQPYNPVDVAGKALTIATDSSTVFARVRGVRVRDLPAGKTVVLSRLSVVNQGSSPNPAIWVHDNAGSVRLVSCNARGATAGYAKPGVRIASSSGSTAWASCDFVGGGGGGGDEVDGYPGGAGLELEDAIAASYDSTITGGVGGFLYIAENAGPGGPGASVLRNALPTRLLLASTSIHGGQGGELYWCKLGQFISGPGGPGFVLGAGATASRLATTFTGGEGGIVPPCGTSGPAGAPLIQSGVLETNPSSALQLTAPTVLREGQVLTLRITGAPGDVVFVISGLRTTLREQWNGALIVQPGGVSQFSGRGAVGTIGASGVLTVSVTLPSLPAGIDAVNLWLQPIARHANGKLGLGSFAVVTLLDSAY